MGTRQATDRRPNWSGCGVDALQAIYERRSVRSYTNRRVGPDTVRGIIEAAIQAPSAVNQQPWGFVVIQDGRLLERLSDRSKGLMLGQIRPGTALWEHSGLLKDPSFNVFYDAGTLIVVCAAPGDWPVNEDCCLAAQNLMLAAHALGLGTCPIGFAREALSEPWARRELGIPAEYSIVMPIIVGYPSEQPAATPRRPARILSWR